MFCIPSFPFSSCLGGRRLLPPSETGLLTLESSKKRNADEIIQALKQWGWLGISGELCNFGCSLKMAVLNVRRSYQQCVVLRAVQVRLSLADITKNEHHLKL